ncbi:hypothetical protein TIFTF001_033295 [Ficus carica]|uniref:Uncharacterized protein n=1 Tax=Ficus carica TaxID=3494 RepID=A0AA88J3J0_FICCA|nr:hypothetical protein TIFTF001_033295 [Ficus carica]
MTKSSCRHHDPVTVAEKRKTDERRTRRTQWRSHCDSVGIDMNSTATSAVNSTETTKNPFTSPEKKSGTAKGRFGIPKKFH